ncbi:carboxymuconolactone decarboxylase family protein [Veronia pacifica]|uniref:Alkylhydroperoxidase n=1 Tax=Veronia pacifica TaxID=1080227 RepID=A0A1C3ERD2_9GAMM|nr:alkylhydroperoxidase [Veronia pacifica]ODA35781.1 alkylhydroperoxidase [Veronia pacifica]
MSWIKTVSYEDASDNLKKLYDRVKGPDNNVDNIMLAHSLRPHTMEGHMTIYKYVLHHPRNTVPKWFLEAIGVYVSYLNRCNYCFDHHFEGMKRLLNTSGEQPLHNADKIKQALQSHNFDEAFDTKHAKVFDYVRTLTVSPGNTGKRDIQGLQTLGWSDGEILEINQVTAYFAYANRTVTGLGINTDGDILGLSPNDGQELDNWNHS